jgi:hypothetical protein
LPLSAIGPGKTSLARPLLLEMADVFDAHGEVRVHALTGAYCACAPNLGH